MTQPPDFSETGRTIEWSDEQVEQALTWFYARELPAALREQNLQPALWRPEMTAGSRAAARPAGRWLIPLCLAALIGSGVILRRAPDMLAVASSADASRVVRLDTTSLPLESEQFSFVGAHHQFSQRNELRWISESYFEPATGDLVEWSAPELIIDVDTIADRESDLLQ